ncbi:MAG: hypothetical protein V1773_19430 [bacterium]
MNEIIMAQQKKSVFKNKLIPCLNFLRNCTLKKTRDVDDSMDLLQNILLKVFNCFDKYLKGPNIKNWL